jgi:peptide/nickel transport system substrate-binding protein
MMLTRTVPSQGLVAVMVSPGGSSSMDYSQLDKVRRSTTPLQLDAVESFARGRISRREFIKRGTIVGLSMASIGAVIAACGGATPSASGAAPASAAGGSAPAGKVGGTIKVACQRPKGLDPIGMQDLASYGITAQSFEFLCTLNAKATDIAPGLAEKWTPDATNKVWTFNLRQGVTWQDGSPFTSADVVATMERLIAAGNAGLKGVITTGSVVATDANTATFNLAGANGNFPYLVSVFNAQSLITPAAFATGTTLDAKPGGTGAWKLDSFDVSSGAKFSRNDKWWGGQTPLDSTEFVFFDDTASMVTAYQGGQADALVQFDVLTGGPLFTDPNFTVVETPTTNHRQIWMRCDKGQFKDKKVRQALALTFDRPKMIEQLFKGKAIVANDHVIAPFYPYFSDTVPQRVQNIDMAKQLLSDAGVTNLAATLEYGQLNEIPDLAVLIKSQAAQAGITITPHGGDNNNFYGLEWCPEKPADPPCSGAAELGIVDYGHRATPDVFLNSALKTKGVWNSSQYSSADFDAAFGEFQAAVGVDAQKTACAKIEKILNDDTPIGLPFFYNYLSGNSKKFTGVYTCALGQMFLSSASAV